MGGMEEPSKMIDFKNKQLHRFNIGQKVNIVDKNFIMKPYHSEGNAIDEQYIIGLSLKIIYDYANRINNTEVKYFFNQRKNDYNNTTVYEIDEEYVFRTEEEALAYLRNDDDFRSMNPHLIGLDEE